MADIQSAAAEIRRGKKKEQTTAWKYRSALFHRATIMKATYTRTCHPNDACLPTVHTVLFIDHQSAAT